MAIHRILDQTYIDRYSEAFSKKVCGEYFTDRQYMSGQEIIQLTASKQLNLMAIKILFDRWQEQMEAMARNPYFDFRDYAVKEALVQFMNTLSRAIKIERSAFEPLLNEAVRLTLQLGADPVSFFEQEWDSAEAKPAGYFKDLKKYIKWHAPAWQPVASSLADHPENSEWKQELKENFEKNASTLDATESLLEPLNEKLPIDYNQLWASKTVAPWEVDAPEPAVEREENSQEAEQTENELPADIEEPDEAADETATEIDPALAWAKFESEEYAFMKGSITHLREGMGINQRIMFTKRLFQGNQDLLDQTLDELNRAESFFDAVNLLNQGFVHTLKWDVNSEEVQELLQLVFRKFDGEED
ncbi:MAG: hypothetical protein R6V72_04105 [Cyclobacterium sp.]|uniref:hypothetical protein n=1 Tax=unclassified Cyclobacterium TaxID=2615055 RepID=UPI0013D11CB7|nr:hypothetical protein [Cyclobacterium sp. SYSU L10401]